MLSRIHSLFEVRLSLVIKFQYKRLQSRVVSPVKCETTQIAGSSCSSTTEGTTSCTPGVDLHPALADRYHMGLFHTCPCLDKVRFDQGQLHRDSRGGSQYGILSLHRSQDSRIRCSCTGSIMSSNRGRPVHLYMVLSGSNLNARKVFHKTADDITSGQVEQKSANGQKQIKYLPHLQPQSLLLRHRRRLQLSPLPEPVLLPLALPRPHSRPRAAQSHHHPSALH